MKFDGLWKRGHGTTAGRTALLFWMGITGGFGTAGAAMYRWTDKGGMVHITSTPPDKSAAAGAVKTIDSVSPAPSRPKPGAKKYSEAGTMTTAPIQHVPPPAAAVAPKKAAPPAKRAPQIEIYSASWCGPCRALKSYLHEKGFAYTDYDVDNDAAASERCSRLNPGNSIPVTVIDGEVIVGFAKAHFDQILAQYQ